MTCQICLENYTPLLRCKVTCPYCPSAACKGCVQRYLLTTYEDPHCMTCKRGWNREFIDLHLTKAFRSDPLRKHRAKVLRDREKAVLPAMQIFVEATKEIRAVGELFTTVLAKNRDLAKVKAELLRERDMIRQKIRLCTNKADEEALMGLLDLNSEKYGKNEGVVLRVSFDQEVLTRRQMRAMNIMEGRNADDNTVKEVREFIQRCPGDGCRGYLSTAYKCGVCAKYACSECLAVKGEDRDAAHTCDESAKATAALIRRETKPCPKCGVRIYKIDGCDQMWCTQEGCQTAFSWTTGRVVTGTIHNPHYYEFLRQRGNGAAPPREAGDIPCGGIPVTYPFTRMIAATALPLPEKAVIYNVHRCINDIVNARLPDYLQRRPANANMDINILYLMNEMDEDTWKKMLEQRETRFERKKEIGQILQMFGHVGAEFLRALERAGTTGAGEVWIGQVKDQVVDLRTYTNKSLAELGKRMMCAFPQIDKDWFYVPPRKDAVNDNPVAPAAPAAGAPMVVE